MLGLFVVGLTAAGQQQRWPWEPANWRLQATLRDDEGRPVHLNDVVFIDRLRGWIVGERGGVWHTADGGASWTRQDSATKERLRGVDFLDADRGWIVGSWNTVLATGDGGRSWTRLTETAPIFPASVKFADALRGWMGGSGG
jgi:photosystem II stability/assembly factor-like uncharacterized protein